MDSPEYVEKLKPFQDGIPNSIEENKKRYLLPMHELAAGKKRFDTEGTLKRFEHLLGVSNLFRHFIEKKAEKDPKFREVLDIIDNVDNKARGRGKKNANSRTRKSEKEEDAELMKDEEEEDDFEDVDFQFRESPAYINGE